MKKYKVSTFRGYAYANGINVAKAMAYEMIEEIKKAGFPQSMQWTTISSEDGLKLYHVITPTEVL